jgi:sugar lactone lactonase YvrE
LPDGAMLALDGAAWLVWRGALRRWSPAGYDARLAPDPGRTVQALTPAVTMAAMRAGYCPQVHETAGRS